MISTLLGKIANLFEKDFLFSSFLPALLFLTSLALPTACSLGLLAVFAYIETMSAVEKAVAVFAAGIVTITFGYVLHALRPTFLRFWSGSLSDPLGFVRLGEIRERKRYYRLKKSAYRREQWGEVFDQFRTKMQSVWQD